MDSLDLSYSGRLNPTVEKELGNLKHLAQSADDEFQALAQLYRGDHVLAVHDKGYRFFPYVLSSDFFRITLAGVAAERLPMAVCQVRNYALMSFGPEKCEQMLRELLCEFGELEGDAVVSRVDLAVDFMTSDDLSAWGHEAWITRIRAKRKHADGDRFSGWDIGAHGDPASFGLYDKTLEVELRGGKGYMHEIWERAGRVPWDPPVWRAEARFRREFLRRFTLRALREVLAAIPALWKVFVTETLRLVVPSAEDRTRSRWGNHRLWTFLEGLDWGQAFVPIEREQRKISAPSRAYFGKVQGSLVTSLMASEGIRDPEEAHRRLWLIARDHYAWADPCPAEAFLKRARVKQRRYGVRVDTEGLRVPPLPESAAARSYREGSRGK